MSDKIDEVLSEIKDTHNEIKQIKEWLYGANGFEGDIPQIKVGLEDHNKRIRRVEIIIAGLIGSGILGSGIWALLN